MRLISWALLAATALLAALAPGLVRGEEPGIGGSDDGRTVWVTVPEGRLKTRLYKSQHLGDAPVLILFLHGDVFRPAPSYQYRFAQLAALGGDNVVAAGVLRPGYVDQSGDRSDGDIGVAGFNHSQAVVDAIDAAARQLAAEIHAGAVIVAGHSGGAGIAATLLGRHPGTAQAALLIACGCDAPDVSSLELAGQVSPSVHVLMVVGDADDVVGVDSTERYVRALAERGIDAIATVMPAYRHNNATFTPTTFRLLGALAAKLGGAVADPEALARPVDAAVLAGYAGQYRFKPNFAATVRADGNRLLARLTGDDEYQLFARSETDFSYLVVDASIRFERGADGRATAVVLQGPYGPPLRGPREP